MLINCIIQRLKCFIGAFYRYILPPEQFVIQKVLCLSSLCSLFALLQKDIPLPTPTSFGKPSSTFLKTDSIFQIDFRFIEKLRGQYEKFPYTLHPVFPITSILSQYGICVIINALILMHFQKIKTIPYLIFFSLYLMSFFCTRFPFQTHIIFRCCISLGFSLDCDNSSDTSCF